MLDAARAAERLPEAGLSADTPVGIMGYSQGGQASSWAAELQGSYAPELKVKGTATGGVPADLMKVADFNNGSYGSGLIFMAAAGQDAAFPELRLDSYLNPAGKALVSRHEGELRGDRRDHAAPSSGSPTSPPATPSNSRTGRPG